VPSRRRSRILAVLAAAAAALAGLGGAAPAHAGGAATLRLTGVHAHDGGHAVLAGERFAVRGRVSGARPGERVSVSFRRGRRTVKAVGPRLDRRGRYAATFRPGLPGMLTVAVRRAGQARAAASARVAGLKPFAGNWERGPHVRFLQRRLAGMGYAVSVTGLMDWQAQRALVAFRKVNDLHRVTNATRGIFAMVARGRGAYRPRYPSHGRHVEGDLTHQVVALVNPGGRVHRVFITSSGRAGLRTPTGNFRVFRQHWGWQGGMLDGSYFAYSGGYTCGVHGYPWVPTYPQSHCCLRVPVADSRAIRRWIRIGTRVDVFYRRHAARSAASAR
jgi:hypothetical protein